MQRIKNYAELVKFEHTIFALPFALASLVLLYETFPTFWKVLWILIALISARTAGMALNRLIDLPFDRENPRTKDWVHVSGRVSRVDILLLIALSSFIFILSTYFINLYALLLSPVVLFLLWLYPYSKRFTYFPHLFLGTVYFLIPLGVDVALNERISFVALFLGTAMAFWVAGFDVLYSLQDYEFDRSMGLKSIPTRFGVGKALIISRLFHVITFLSLLSVGFLSSKAGSVYMIGLFILASFLFYEHYLVRKSNLSNINKAFFTVNGFISILFFFVVALDRLLGG